MNDSDDLRDILGRGADSLPPLDPAKVIAGAHRRRRVRGLASAGVACAAVVAVVAAGAVVGGNGPSGHQQPGTPVVGPGEATPSGKPSLPATPTFKGKPSPSETPRFTGKPPLPPGPKTAPSTADRTPIGPTRKSSGPAHKPGQAEISVAACLSALMEASEPGLNRKEARTRLRLDTAAGTTLVVADRDTWLGCDQSRHDGDDQPSLILPGKILAPPSTAKVDPFRVSTLFISIGSSLHERFWAAGRLPNGVKTIRYTFWDGTRQEAKVSNGFWAMQYQRSQPDPAYLNLTKLARTKVELVAPDGRSVKTFRLDWATDTCAQINHGC